MQRFLFASSLLLGFSLVGQGACVDGNGALPEGGTGGSVFGTGGATNGTGGVANGSGGKIGSGGAIGSGGITPIGGNGGGTGDICSSGGTCNGIEAEYAAALPGARGCTPGADGQCSKMANGSLGGCVGCPMWVNDDTKLKSIASRWAETGCARCVLGRLCPAIACINPGTMGVCQMVAQPAPGGPAGQCAAGGFTPQ